VVDDASPVVVDDGSPVDVPDAVAVSLPGELGVAAVPVGLGLWPEESAPGCCSDPDGEVAVDCCPDPDGEVAVDCCSDPDGKVVVWLESGGGWPWPPLVPVLVVCEPEEVEDWSLPDDGGC